MNWQRLCSWKTVNFRFPRLLLMAALLALTSLFSRADGFEPTVSNKDAPGKAPEGMVWIPGGEFSMGAAINGHGSGEMPMASNDAEPVHRVRVDGFWMDTTTVTNEQFEKF